VDGNGFGAIAAGGSWAGDIGAHPYDNDNADWDFRVNNAVKYVSPTYRGFTAEGMYAFSTRPAGSPTTVSMPAPSTIKMAG
jgi:predicted porin